MVLPTCPSSHLSRNRDWPTPKRTHRASSAPTYPATSSRTVWSTSCLLSPPASACSPSAAWKAPTISMPAALTATGQQRTFWAELQWLFGKCWLHTFRGESCLLFVLTVNKPQKRARNICPLESFSMLLLFFIDGHPKDTHFWKINVYFNFCK